MNIDEYVPWESILLVCTRALSAAAISFAIVVGAVGGLKAAGLLRKAQSAERMAQEAELDLQSEQAIMAEAEQVVESRGLNP